MSQFWLYFNLGLEHVLDWQAYDHVLFITVLVAAYSLTEWKKILWLVTLFTLGHTVSLALSTFEIVKVKSELIEFLIPLTILLTAIYNLTKAGKKGKNNKIQVLYFATIFFGIIHGLGFSTYFKMISGSATNKALPLLEFALGIEAAQIIVVLAVLLISFLFQYLFKFTHRDWILVVSSIVIGFAIPMLIENIFW
ncbi:HupE/UreJ family protein [Salinimicrobium sp. GXAS 041]|uniref:HupE/UreJ family protein n=1 Tax=Salinimicrobium sp. GXAS 041 TaxID=3400806 RepID=UPI003C72BC0F